VRGAAIAVHPCATIAGVSSHRRARARLLALGAALGIGLLVAGAGALAASASLSQSPATVGVVALATTTTGPPVTLAQQALAGAPTSPPTTLASSGIPGSTAVPTTVGTVAPGEFAAFDESLRSGLIGNGALAISVAVAKDGKLLHTAAFGVANPATGEVATPTSRFRLASNSKLLTATAILQLVEAGQLALDEPVLPRLATRLGVAFTDGRMAAVTLRQLLSHTSGMPEYDRSFFGGGAATCEDAARRGLTSGLIGPPGTVYRYSNMNFCLLGLLVEDVTGKPYATVVQDRVLHPLGIEDMRMAGTYDVQPGDVAHPTTPGRTFMEALAGAGAWIGTPTDLVRIVDGLDRSRPGWHPLSAATVTASPYYATTQQVGGGRCANTTLPCSRAARTVVNIGIAGRHDGTRTESPLRSRLGGSLPRPHRPGCPAPRSLRISAHGRRSSCARWSSLLRPPSPGPAGAAEEHRVSPAPGRRAQGRPSSALTPSDAPPSISAEVACVRQIHRMSVSDLSADWRRGG
jgi:D-alanyl-D-alanine carboxypeptidase